MRLVNALVCITLMALLLPPAIWKSEPEQQVPVAIYLAGVLIAVAICWTANGERKQ